MESVPFEVEDVSSEDKEFPSKHLENSDQEKAWTSADPGVAEAYVVLKLKNPCQIKSILVQNNFSGLLEVFGIPVASSPNSWDSIVAKSSLMTPGDGRKGINGNAERELHPSPDFSNTVFEALKFVCQQPFNKHLKYGLSRIRVLPTKTTSNGTTKSGGIFLKKKEKSGEIKTGDLFSSSSKAPVVHVQSSSTTGHGTKVKSDHEISPEVVSTQEAVNGQEVSPDSDFVASSSKPLKLKKSGAGRQSSPSEDKMEPSTSKGKGRKRKEGAGKSGVQKETDEEDEKKSRGKKSRKQQKNDRGDDDPEVKKGSTKKTKKTSRKRSRKDSEHDDDEGPSSSVNKKSRRGTGSENLKDIMKGVVFALSGFVNPERSELREKACDMGAKYKSDWTSDCTHLICAFANTPKFTQVREAGGKIVRKEWIHDCLTNKRMMPWRNYMLKPSKSANADEEDVDEEMEEAKFNEDEEWEPEADSSVEDEEDESDDDSEEVLSEELESDDEPGEEDDISGVEDEDDDIEDEGSVSSRTKKNGKKSPPKPRKKVVKSKRKGAHFDSDSEDSDALQLTDSEEPDIDEKQFVPRQLALLRGKHFFLFGEFTGSEEKKIKDTITSLSGSIREYNDEKVTHCITNSDWSEEFDEAITENPKLVVVTPEWLFDCEKLRKLPDHKLYKPKN